MGRSLEPQNPAEKFTPFAEIKLCLETKAKGNSFTTESLCSALHTQELVKMVPILQKQHVCNFPQDL